MGLETHDPKIKSLMLNQLSYRNILTQNSDKNNQIPPPKKKHLSWTFTKKYRI